MNCDLIFTIVYEYWPNFHGNTIDYELWPNFHYSL